jgi:threonine synthase
LQAVSALAGAVIPPVIQALFERPVAQDLVIDKHHIEDEVLAFL